VIPLIWRKASIDAECEGGFGGKGGRSALVPAKSSECPWFGSGSGNSAEWWADGKLEGTAFYVDRLSPIATMQVMSTFA
jgi:hypothetical protein